MRNYFGSFGYHLPEHNGNVDEAFFGIASKARTHARRVEHTDRHSGDINLLIIFNWIFYIAKRNHCKTTAAAGGSEDGNGEKKIEIAGKFEKCCRKLL